MPAPILTTADYDAVRAAIDTQLTDSDLPESVISLDIYQGHAESWAAQVDVGWSDRAGNQLKALQRGTIYKLASLLVRALPILSQENFGNGEGFTRQKVDVAQRAAMLESLAYEQLNSYLALELNSTVRTMPTSFRLAHGNRGY